MLCAALFFFSGIVLLCLRIKRFYLRPVLAFGYCRCLRLSVCPCLNHELVCTITFDRFNYARIAAWGPDVQNTLVENAILLVGWGGGGGGRRLTMTFNFHYAGSTTKVNRLEKIHNSQNRIDYLTVPTVSARVYIPGLLHVCDCFTVSTLCTCTDIGSRVYSGARRRPFYHSSRSHSIYTTTLHCVHSNISAGECATKSQPLLQTDANI